MSSDVSAGVPDSLDGALRDRTLSKDAMRWVPEEEREAPTPEPVPVAVTMDSGPFTAAMQDMGRMLSRLFGDALGRLAPLLAAFTGIARADARWRERRRGGGKLAVDGYEYRRRQAARRRRR